MTVHRKAILAAFDLHKNDIVTSIVKIYDHDIESSWQGWMWHSNIGKIFPEYKEVQPYKLYFIDQSGQKKYVRLIMSFNKHAKVFGLF